MELQKSNTSFGAFVSPKAVDMPHFKKFLSKKTGIIDKEALGRFVVDQSKNHKVDMQFRRIAEKDYFAVYPVDKPDNLTLIDCAKEYIPKWKEGISQEWEKVNKQKDGIVKSFNTFKTTIKEKFAEKQHATKWESLPESMKYAGRVADEMEKLV